MNLKMVNKNRSISFERFNPKVELGRVVKSLEEMSPVYRTEAIKLAEQGFYEQAYDSFKLGYISPEQLIDTFADAIFANPFQKLRGELNYKRG